MQRNWIFRLLLIGLIWLVVSRFAEVEKLAGILSHGLWQWLLVAALLQFVYYLLYSGLYQSSFQIAGVQSHLSQLLPVLLASLFVNVVAPSGGTAGAALFVDEAARRGQPPGRVAAGTLLVMVADFTAFTLILTFGLIYLGIQHELKTYELAATIILLLVIGGLSGLLLVGLWRPAWLLRLFSGFQKTLQKISSWLKRPPFLPENWAEKNVSEYIDASQAIRSQPRLLGRTLAVALAAHLVDLLSLYAIFLAYRQPIRPGALIAGFAIGILFWIVAIAPQGIGVVEGTMALVYTSLGVPGQKAAAIALAFRGLTFWLPMFLGFLVLRRVGGFSRQRTILAESWSVRIAAILTAIMGAVNVLSAVTPSLTSRLALLRAILPLEVRRGSRLAAALAGFALILLASNLWRRKRVAWLLTLIVLAISIVSHLLKGLDYEESLLAAALGVWLFTLHPHFHARSDTPSIQTGLRVLMAASLFTLTYGIAGFYLLDRHFSQNFNLVDAARQTVIMFTQFYDPGLVPITGFGRFFANSIYIVGAATLAYALVMLVRPVLVRHPATPAERGRAAEIVACYGRSSLARFTLFEDKSYFFSPGGSVIAFVPKGRIALALGDPIGPETDIPKAITHFTNYCAQNDWQAAFYQTLPDYLEVYRQAGFKSLCIGYEGIVDLASFTLQGGAYKPLRTAVNRLNRLQHTAEFCPPPQPDELLAELRLVSDEWLTMRRGAEKRFSLGWFENEYIRACPVMAIRTPVGIISAFANILTEYSRNEATIDLMRHRKNIENGTMEFLFVTLLQWAQKQGYATFNLGLSGLAGVGEHSNDPSIEKALHFIYKHVNQFYNFKGLHAFKEKFHPEWSPRYLIYPSAASLPAVALALVRADSGDVTAFIFRNS